MIVRNVKHVESDFSRVLASCIKEHRAMLGRFNRLNDYYCGRHEILSRVMVGDNSPNNRIVCNHAKYITDTAIGYAFGNPVTYEGMDEMVRLWESMDIQGHDAELAKDLSVFGNGYELMYISPDTKQPRMALIDPRQAFVVYDDGADCRPLFAVHYYRRTDSEGKETDYGINVYNAKEHMFYTANDVEGTDFVHKETNEHFFGCVPMVEYWNNEEGMGDFEGVMSLIDAYNKLASDRINDKERFVNAILFVQGFTFDEGTVELLKEHGILEAPGDNADAKYLIKTLDETQTEILRAAIEQDIHKLSMVPCLSDGHFSGNSSGVALSYKVMGLNNLVRIKERFFVQGVKRRVEIFSNIMRVLGRSEVKIEDVRVKLKLEG